MAGGTCQNALQHIMTEGMTHSVERIHLSEHSDSDVLKGIRVFSLEVPLAASACKERMYVVSKLALPYFPRDNSPCTMWIKG